MMDDKELVEVWRAQFQRLHKTNSIYGFEMRHGEYIDDDVEDHWKTFLMAKRSQPVIELPELKSISDEYDPADVFDAITDAGYQYKVKK